MVEYYHSPAVKVSGLSTTVHVFETEWRFCSYILYNKFENWNWFHQKLQMVFVRLFDLNNSFASCTCYIMYLWYAGSVLLMGNNLSWTKLSQFLISTKSYIQFAPCQHPITIYYKSITITQLHSNFCIKSFSYKVTKLFTKSYIKCLTKHSDFVRFCPDCYYLGCEHLCVEVLPGVKGCQCEEGYQLGPDRQSCIAKGSVLRDNFARA